MTLNELGKLANENAKAHGFYDLPEAIKTLPSWVRKILESVGFSINPVPQQIALMHSELSEALECYRDGEMQLTFDDKGKPLGYPSELADVIIRIVDQAYELNIDLDKAVTAKMAYNATRPYKHGRKVL
jgi:NTP pyrophosphatase (non-canonical NTP hydrolase)